VICSLGGTDRLGATRKLVGDELAAQIKPVWGLNEEKELCGLWRSDSGVDKLWYALGKCLWDSYKLLDVSNHSAQEVSRCVDPILDI
jgi:hypothetical protein